MTIDGADARRDAGEPAPPDRRGLAGPFLFSDTVTNNIRYGRPEATEAEVMGGGQAGAPTTSSSGRRRATTRYWANVAPG